LRRSLAALAAGHLLAMSLGLPAVETRDPADAGLAPATAPSASHRNLVKAPRVGNPDDDFSDAIPAYGLAVFPCAVPVLDVPGESPDSLVGEPEAPRLRVFGARADFERGPPILS